MIFHLIIQNNMSVIFCDKSGRAIFRVAEDNTRLIDESGKTHGYVEGEHVFGLDGSHRGWYLDGLLRDNDGNVVAFWSDLRTAPTCPVLPVLQQPFPVTPVSEVAPTQHVFGMTHIMPQLHLEWSAINPLAWLR